MDDIEAPRKRPGLDDPSVVLFLGLYLILLAFFILLSSISTTDARRSADAIGSVSTTFQAGGRDRPSGTSIVVETGAGQVDDRMLGAIERTFRNALPSEEFDREVVSGAIRIVVPIDFLFAPGTDIFQPGRSQFLADLTEVLESKRVGLVTETEVVLRTGTELPPPGSDTRALVIRRAGAVARELVARGVASDTITAGMRRGEANTVAFFFRQSPENRQAVTFEGADF